MEKLLKKKSTAAKKNRYSFATTDEMKKNLDQLKKLEPEPIDVNEMLRKYAERLISLAKDQSA